MASVNKVILVGNVGRDPETRYAPSGGAVVNLSLATTRNWKDKASGERREETEWHRVVFYDRLAEIVGEYVRKGRSIYVEGRLKTRKWQDKDGIEKYTTEIIADELQLLGSREGGGGGGGGGEGFGGGRGSGRGADRGGDFGGDADGGYSREPAAAANRGGRPQGGGKPAPVPESGGFEDDDIPF